MRLEKNCLITDKWSIFFGDSWRSVTFCYKALVPLRGAKCRNETIKQPGETLDNRGVSSSRAIIARKSLSQSLYSRPTARPGIEGVRRETGCVRVYPVQNRLFFCVE